MRIAVLTFDGFNEIDSFVVLNLLNRLSARGWKAEIAAAGVRVVSGNGVAVEAQRPLEFAAEADAVGIGSGRWSRQIADDPAMLRRLALDPRRQLIASQCSGALILAALGLLDRQPVCTDHTTRPLLAGRGVMVLDRAFHAEGNVATAGGCLSAPYIATWIMARRLGLEAATQVIHYAAPVGEEDETVARAVGAVRPFLGEPVAA
jgi:transcriptional regulator GlxA family with amidase domain